MKNKRITVTTKLWGAQHVGARGTIVEATGADYRGEPYCRVMLDSGESIPPLMVHEFRVEETE
jgi:hypothetical protein